MKIVIAPDSFKGTLTANEVCAIIASAFRETVADCEMIQLPAADGGEGLCVALSAVLDGAWIQAQTTGVFGEAMTASYYMLPDKTAVVEMAACAGLPLAGERKNPEQASTYGVGLLLRHAAQNGAKKILLGLGGSASNDCGVGMAAALGYRFLDEAGERVEPVGQNLARIARICPPKEPWRIPVIAACDVDNPLYGAQGAAFVFAPQKGADAAMVRRLDDGLRHVAKLIERDLNSKVAQKKGAGAAGGFGAGAIAFLGAELKKGIDIVLDALQFDRQIAQASLVITGEGKLDAQSGRGKVVSGVLARAQRQNIPAIIICGCAEPETALYRGVTPVFACGKANRSIQELQKNCKGELYQAACRAVRAIVSGAI